MRVFPQGLVRLEVGDCILADCLAICLRKVACKGASHHRSKLRIDHALLRKLTVGGGVRKVRDLLRLHALRLADFQRLLNRLPLELVDSELLRRDRVGTPRLVLDLDVASQVADLVRSHSMADLVQLGLVLLGFFRPLLGLCTQSVFTALYLAQQLAGELLDFLLIEVVLGPQFLHGLEGSLPLQVPVLHVRNDRRQLVESFRVVVDALRPSHSTLGLCDAAGKALGFLVVHPAGLIPLVDLAGQLCMVGRRVVGSFENTGPPRFVVRIELGKGLLVVVLPGLLDSP